MLYSGISWSTTGYEVQVVDDSGRQVMLPARFGAGRTDEMIAYLKGIDGPLSTAVESTNGILDGRMMAAGLDMYRADPWILPGRPLLGSVPAIDLARAAQRDLSALTKLNIGSGTQTGRETELNDGITASMAEEASLTAAGRCLRHGERDRPEIALTFDDGPLPRYTRQVLDVLERYEVKATFFCVGLHAAGHADDIARISAQGHALGNHTWSHPFLPELSYPQLTEQIERTQETIAAASGGAAPTLFRPPYGSRTPEVMGWLGETVSTIVLWDVDASDWALPGADKIARIVLDQAQPGSIILLHDGGGDRSQTVAALPAIIEGLQERGYRFTLVEDLLPARAASV